MNTLVLILNVIQYSRHIENSSENKISYSGKMYSLNTKCIFYSTFNKILQEKPSSAPQLCLCKQHKKILQMQH